MGPEIRLSELVPRTKQDYIGMIPQNLMVVYRLSRKGHTIF